MSRRWQVLERATATQILLSRPENSPTSPANTSDLEEHINELEEMHEVAEIKLVELAIPTVLFSRIYKLEILELDDAETNPPVN